MTSPVVPDPVLSARWDAGLARFALSSRTDHDRLARAVLDHPDGREYLVSRLNDQEFGDAAWALARGEVERLAAGGGADWIDAACTWLQAGQADWARSADFCADVAWRARAEHNSALLHLSARDVAATAFAAPGDRGRLHLLLQSQRYDFRFRAIRQTVAALSASPEVLDPFSRAIHTFALLAQGADGALDEMDAVRRLGPDNRKVAHALLHGLWFADQLPDQAERILDLVDSTDLFDPEDSVVCLRKAFALRRLRRYDEALRAIDDGISYLSPQAVEVHADFVRERSIILAVRDIGQSYRDERQMLNGEFERHLAELGVVFDDRVAKVEEKISDSLFKVVEILALFTAIVALLASGAASVTIGSLAWWQRAVLVLTAGFVVMVFFFAIRIVVRPGNRPHRSRG
jgi:hypothetical protein